MAIPKMSKVEACIAWAAQHGYAYAADAALEYGQQAAREMYEDQPYYASHAWRPVGGER